MISNTKKALLLGCSLFVPLSAAYAETTDGSTDIVVTANKRQENINKVGLTITALTADALAERKIASVEDVAASIPGLSFASSATATPILTLRGVGFQEFSLGVYPAVSVYMDQAPLLFPALTAHSAFDLERVEVLKGPQGTLFGQNSTGGAINYIAAKPTNTFQAGGDISYGRFNTIEGNAFISGPLSDSLRGRIAVNGLNSDDWQYSYTRQDSTGKQSYIAGRVLLDWDASSALKFQLNVNGWQDNSTPQAQQLIATHEGLSATGSALPNQPALVDPLRNAYNPPYVVGGASANLTYPFGPLNARAADWSTQALDPTTSTVQNPDGSSDPTKASYSTFTPRGNRKFLQASLRTDLNVTDDITLTSLTSYLNYWRDQRVDSDGMALVAYDFQTSHGTVRSFNQELRLANSTKNQFRWMLGGNFEDTRTAEDLEIRYIGNTNFSIPNMHINSSGDRLNQKIRNYAFFGNAEYAITPELTFKGAIRYTESRIAALNGSYNRPNGNVNELFNVLGGLSGLPFTPIGPNQSYTLNVLQLDQPLPAGLQINSPLSVGGNGGLGIPGVPFDAVLKQHNVSWRVGLDYQITPDVLFYANVSRGYKAGSFPTVAAASYTSMLPVTQEKVTAYEAGLKASFADRKVQLNLAGFYYDYRDKQVRGKLYDAVFGTIDLLVNVPKSRIWGAEADLTVRPVEGLSLNGAVTYLDTKILKYFGYDPLGGVGNANYVDHADNRENLAGNPLPYTPKWSGLFNADYRFSALGGTPFIGLTVRGQSKQDAAIGGGTTPIPVGPRYRIAPGIGQYPYMIDGYATVDARLGFESADKSWRVMLWGKNIFNKYYWTSVVASSDSSGRLAGRPVTYGITLGFKTR